MPNSASCDAKKPFDPKAREGQDENIKHLRLKLAENAQGISGMQQKIMTAEEELAAVRRGIPLAKFRRQKMLEAIRTGVNPDIFPLSDNQPDTNAIFATRTTIPPEVFPRPYNRDEAQLDNTVFDSHKGLANRVAQKKKLEAQLETELKGLERWIRTAKFKRQINKKNMWMKGARWTPDEEEKLKENEEVWGALGFDLYPELWARKAEKDLLSMEGVAVAIEEAEAKDKVAAMTPTREADAEMEEEEGEEEGEDSSDIEIIVERFWDEEARQMRIFRG